MKRILGALLVTVGLAAGPISPANAAPDDQVKGPGCGDIDADVNFVDYFDLSGTIILLDDPTVFATVDTAKPSCDGGSYVLDVFELDGTAIGSAAAAGDGSANQFQLSVVASDRTEVCVVVSSQTANGKVMDQAPNAPDAQCATGAYFFLNGATGGRVMK